MLEWFILAASVPPPSEDGNDIGVAVGTAVGVHDPFAFAFLYDLYFVWWPEDLARSLPRKQFSHSARSHIACVEKTLYIAIY